MSSLTTLALVEFVIVASLFVLLAQGARLNRLSSVFLPQRANVTAARRRVAATASRRGGSTRD